MSTIPVGQITTKFECKTCGPTHLVLSDGEDNPDSVVTCGTCGVEFGRWADVKAGADAKTRAFAIKTAEDLIRKALKG